MREAERLEILLADEQERGVIDGGYRRGVIAPVKDRQFGHGAARSVHTEHVLPAARRTLEDADMARFHNVQSHTGLAFGKDNLARSMVAWNRALREKGQLVLGQTGKDRDFRERLGMIHFRFRHGIYCTQPMPEAEVSQLT